MSNPDVCVNRGARLDLVPSTPDGNKFATTLSLTDLPAPVPDPHQALIRIRAVGICGSDVHYWTHGAIGDFVMREPMLLGHECAGEVVGIGSAVTNLKVGDRVAIEPGVPCRRCEHCKGGRYNLCPDMRFLATPPIHGALCTLHAHDADFCHVLPPGVTFEEGALVEPLSVAVHACRRAGVTGGTTCLVLGCGPIGLVCAMAARAFGATTVVAADVFAERLAFAQRCGADHTLHITSPKGDLPPLPCPQVDVVFECCGADSALAAAFDAAKPGGVVMAIGMGAPLATVPLLRAACREVDVRGIFRYVNCYPAALALIAAKKLPGLGELVTHRVPFGPDTLLPAFMSAYRRKDETGKPTVKVMFILE